jgi:hypothetical protein
MSPTFDKLESQINTLRTHGLLSNRAQRSRLDLHATSSTEWPNSECRLRRRSGCEFGFLRSRSYRLAIHAPTPFGGRRQRLRLRRTRGQCEQSDRGVTERGRHVVASGCSAVAGSSCFTDRCARVPRWQRLRPSCNHGCRPRNAAAGTSRSDEDSVTSRTAVRARECPPSLQAAGRTGSWR